jgi:TPR repeat protein
MRICLFAVMLGLLAGCDTADSGLRAYRRGDYAGAAQIWRRAAERGDRDAQYHLGLLYRDGQGVPTDRAQALAWFRKSADQGFTDSQLQIGVMYAQGLGVPRDYAQAREWYLRAAAKQNSWALHNLGMIYLYGQGVSKDEAKAWDYLRQSADGNNPWAQRRLGEWHAARAELVEAYKWYSLAMKTGDQKAKDQRRDVAAKMNFQQIDQAEELTEKWRMKSAPLWRARTPWQWAEMLLVIAGLIAELAVSVDYVLVWVKHRKQGPHWEHADRVLHERAPSLPRRWLLLFRPAGIPAWALHILFFTLILAAVLALAGGVDLGGFLLMTVVLLAIHAAAIHCDRRALAARLVHIRGTIERG